MSSQRATHLEVDGPPVDTERIWALLAERGLALSAVSCYENNLIGDPVKRRRIHSHLRACIHAASALGVPHVGTFVGRDAARTVADNLREAEKLLPELVWYAEDHGVRLVIENCPMQGWHPDGLPDPAAVDEDEDEQACWLPTAAPGRRVAQNRVHRLQDLHHPFPGAPVQVVDDQQDHQATNAEQL